MKRGKRQVIQKSNIFGSEDQSPKEQPFSSQISPSSWTEPSTIQHRKDIDPVHHQIQSHIEATKPQPSPVASTADDERKKRLEMLRQKYLKSGGGNPSKEQPKVNEPKVDKAQTSIRKKQQPQRNEAKSFSDQLTSKAQKPVAVYSFNEVKNQNETPISKPTESLEHERVPVPVPQEPKRRKVPPPPPRQVPSIRKEQQNQESPPEQQKPKNIVNDYPQIKKEKKTKMEIIKSQEEQFESFEVLIDKWLSSGVPEQREQDCSHILIQIVKEVAPNSQVSQSIALAFIVNNKVPYTKEQVDAIMKALEEEMSTITRLFLSIKCGQEGLSKYGYDIISHNFIPVLQELILLRSHILQPEMNQFISFYLQYVQVQKQIIPLFIQLAPSCQALYDHIGQFQFDEHATIAKVLLAMKSKLNQSICPVYFKLINLVIGEIEDARTLQSLLTVINSIGYQSVYQIKKDTKLRIIERIDKTSNGSLTREPFRDSTEMAARPEKESEEEKGKGLKNLMGYVGQAIKKIASQIPEKPAEAPVQEAKESIQWDPVSKRYLINGKVPEDEPGSSSTQQEGPDNQKKKAPPPPPRNAKRSSQTSKQPVQVDAEPFVQPTQRNEVEANPFSEGLETNEDKDFSPPARVGLKGLPSKKPRLQARYT